MDNFLDDSVMVHVMILFNCAMLKAIIFNITEIWHVDHIDRRIIYWVYETKTNPELLYKKDDSSTNTKVKKVNDAKEPNTHAKKILFKL